MRKMFFKGALLLLLCLAAHPAMGVETKVTISDDLAAAVKIKASCDIKLMNDITLTAPIEIEHSDTKISGGYTLKAKNGRHFKMKSDATVTIEGVTLDGEGSGGGVECSGKKAEFKNVTFKNNKATGDGGALLVKKGTEVTCESSSFENNTAKNGGALWIEEGEDVKLTSMDVLSGNKATDGDGGAVYLKSGTLVLPKISLHNNSAGRNGGAVFIKSSAKAEFNSETMFFGNKATGDGGAVCASGDVTLNEKCTFKSNKADGNGGALYLDASAKADFKAAKTTFSGNEAKGSGGAVYADTFEAPEADLIFESNKATGTDGNGGALCITGEVTLNDHCTFSGNEAGKSGGALYAGGNVTLNGGKFSKGNRAKGTDANDGGGAIYVKGTIDINGKADFEGQTAKGSGGAIYSVGKVKLKEGTFRENKAEEKSGGAIYSVGDVTLNGGEFEKNTAKEDGGAVHAGNRFEANNTKFSRNEAGGNGGAVHAKGNSKVRNSLFEENKSEGSDNSHGGGLYQNTGNTAISNSIFRGNFSQGRGGAVGTVNDEATLDLQESVFEDNQAGFGGKGEGGALCLYPIKTATLKKCTFEGNSSSSSDGGKGGAVFCKELKERITIENCTFYKNEARGGDAKGGALYIGDIGGQAKLTFCTLARNKAEGSRDSAGGGLCFDGGTLRMVGCLIVGNATENLDVADVYLAGGNIESMGFNRLGSFGALDAGGRPGKSLWKGNSDVAPGKLDFQHPSWTFASFFGSNEAKPEENTDHVSAPTKAGPDGAKEVVKTLALNETPGDFSGPEERALDAIPEKDGLPLPTEDQRGLTRPQNMKKDIGAYEKYQEGGGGTPDVPSGGNITSVEIGGIPNFMTVVGQTTALTVLVTYENGTKSLTEPVTWTSTRPSVAKIDEFGVLVAVGEGTAVISADLEGKVMTNDQPAGATARITVNKDNAYTNLYPDFWTDLSDFNEKELKNVVLSLGGPEVSKLIESRSFQTKFKKLWGREALSGKNLKLKVRENFRRGQALSASGWNGRNSALEVREVPGSRTKSQLLPLTLIWRLSPSEVQSLTGSRKPDKNALIRALGIGFGASGGKGARVVPLSEAGEVRVGSGRDGLTVTLTVLLADAKSGGEGGVKALARGASSGVIGKYLVLADGKADRKVDGTLQLMANAGGGGSGSRGGDGEGGGGCSSGFAALALLLTLPFALGRRGRR